MLNKILGFFKDKSWTKIILVSLLALSVVGLVIGIIFSSIDLSNTKAIKEGNNYNNSVESKIYVKLDPKLKTKEEQLKQVEKDASKFVERLRTAGVTEMKVESGIENIKTQLNETTNNWVGVIYLFTTKENSLFTYIDEKNQSKLFEQNFNLYSKFANPFNLVMQSINYANTTNEANFSEKYLILNNKKDSVKPSGSNVEVSLPDTLITNTEDKNNKDWNLSIFQKQFVKTYPGWDGTKTYSELIEANKDVTKPKPDKTLIMWKNRLGLIEMLQRVILITKLNSERFNTLPNDLPNLNLYQLTEAIKNLYNSLTAEQKSFGDWVVASNNIFDVNRQLVEAQSYLNPTVRTPNDPLITLLNSYYTRINSSNSSTEETTNIFSNKDEFLYSWNFKNLTLINSYFSTIDYNNFFDFFNNTTPSKPEDSTYSENNFYSNSLKFTPSKYSVNEFSQYYNTASVDSIIFNPFLNNVNSSNYDAGNLKQFLNACNFIKPDDVAKTKTNINLNFYTSSLILVSVVIISIGIIVSIIYRVPGAFAAILNMFAFLMTLISFNSLGMSFDFSTLMGVFALSLISYYPMLTFLKEIKENIQLGFNLQNAILKSLLRFLKLSLITFVSIFIVALTFLFFGLNQIQEFGSIVVLGTLFTFLFGVVIYLLFNLSLYWIIQDRHLWLMLDKKYISYLNVIDETKFGDSSLAKFDSQQTLLSKFTAKIDFMNFKKSLFFFIPSILILAFSIAGVVLLLTYGTGFSLEFSKVMIISFDSDKVPLTAVQDLATKLNVSWHLVEVVNGKTLIYSDTILNSDKVISTIEQIPDLNNLINTLSIKFPNTIIPNLLKNNFVQVILISIAFLTLWSFISLNFVNAVAIVIALFLNLLIVIGIPGIVRIPFDINSLIVYSQIYLLIVFSIFSSFNSYKSTINNKKRYTKLELNETIKNKFKKDFGFNACAFAMYFVSSLLILIFVAQEQINAIIILLISVVFISITSFIINYYLFFSAMLFREKYLQMIQRGKSSNKKLSFSYDKIDEQEIYGINEY